MTKHVRERRRRRKEAKIEKCVTNTPDKEVVDGLEEKKVSRQEPHLQSPAAALRLEKEGWRRGEWDAWETPPCLHEATPRQSPGLAAATSRNGKVGVQ